MTLPLYLDYMASTPLDPLVLEQMQPYLTGHVGNASSIDHGYGAQARDAIAQAAEAVAAVIHAQPNELIWTSGATESNNLAIKGAAQCYHRGRNHIVTIASEHKAVLAVCEYLARAQGYRLTVLQPGPTGRVNLEELAGALGAETVLVSVMQVNNETGVIQDIPAIAELAHSVGALMHCDAAQSIGRVPVNVREMGVDLLSLSAHKVYGPQGVGALFVSRTPRVRLVAQLHGGTQQWGMRAGTLPTHQIVGMGAAAARAEALRVEEYARMQTLRAAWVETLSDLPGFHVNGDQVHQVPHCLNFYVEHLDGGLLLSALPMIAISRGAACQGVTVTPSHVLSAMGLSAAQARSAVRVSFGRMTESQEAIAMAKTVRSVILRLLEASG